VSHADAKPPTAAARRLCESLRRYAFSFPETHEDHPWGEIALKVRGKVFVFLGADGDEVGFSVKLPESADQALSLPFTQPTPYGLGKSGWVSASIGPKVKAPTALLEAWIEESWKAVAPKTLVKQRDAGTSAKGEKPPPANAKATAKKKSTAKAKPREPAARRSSPRRSTRA
jgi:predicted DNA-binding protein (MmcQ/YjbR family)